MLLNKHDLENKDVRVAGGGTTALGIIGTALGGLAVANMNTGCGGGAGILGNWLGGSRNGGCCDQYATRYDLCQSERIGALESTIATLSADRNTDGKLLSLYDYVVTNDKSINANVNALFNETFKQIGDLKVAEQVNKMEIDKNFQLMNQKVDYENKLTACAINSLRTYVDATFMPVTKKISLCDICPIPQVAAAVQPTLSCSSDGH